MLCIDTKEMAEALAIGGSVLKAGGTLFSSGAQAKSLKSEARQLDTKAGLERASSQREAMEERRKARLLQSRGLAVAAASGGGADDPGVVNILADIAGEGEYRSLTALYEGNERAFGLESEAKARRKEAKNVKTAGYIGAASTLLGAGSSMSERYG